MVHFDWTILKGIQQYMQCGFNDWVMPRVSFLVNGGLIWIALIIVLLCFKKYRRTGILCAIGLIIGLIVGNAIIKNVVVRPRPFTLDPTIHLLIKVPKDFSFPSCHTQASFIMATILMIKDKKLGIPTLIFAIIIGFSRMYLQVHFPTDVIGGAILGIIIGVSVCLVDSYLLKRKQAKE